MLKYAVVDLVNESPVFSTQKLHTGDAKRGSASRTLELARTSDQKGKQV